MCVCVYTNSECVVEKISCNIIVVVVVATYASCELKHTPHTIYKHS